MAETKPQQLFTESQIEEFRHAFEFFDKVRNIEFIFIYYPRHIPNALSIAPFVHSIHPTYLQDRDGTITYQEFGEILRKLGQNPKDSQLRDMMSKVIYLLRSIINHLEII